MALQNELLGFILVSAGSEICNGPNIVTFQFGFQAIINYLQVTLRHDKYNFRDLNGIERFLMHIIESLGLSLFLN